MKMIDLTKFTEPIKKLIEEVSKGIGTLYKPKAIRDEADSKAYEIEQIAIADAKAMQIRGDAKISVLEKAMQRLGKQELSRQNNIEETIDKVVKHLPEVINDTPLNPDWRTRYFNIIQDISDIDLQEIWAKILAVELASPGRISLRGMEILKNISKSEAEKFQLLCSMASEGEYIYKIDNANNFDDFDIKFIDILNLKEAGLVRESSHLTIEVSPDTNHEDEITVSNVTYKVKLPPKTNLNLPVFIFTNVGKTICSTIEVNPNQQYFELILNDLKSKFLTIEVKEILIA